MVNKEFLCHNKSPLKVVFNCMKNNENKELCKKCDGKF